MDKSEYSQDPYQDGTVPADADFAASGDDEASATGDPDTAGTDSADADPDALTRGSRVATAEDME